MSVVDDVRSFNRFYTRRVGLLAQHLPDSDLSLAEARVLYEIARTPGLTAADIIRSLEMDRAHVSRIIGRFRARELVESRADDAHAKRLRLSLTDAGQEAFARLDKGAQSQIADIIAPVPAAERQRLVCAMRELRAILETPAAGAALELRTLQPGDLGWITHRQAVLYHQEFGWDRTYEALVSRILGDFATGFDPAREDAWVAEIGGETVGSVFLVKGGDGESAKLRLLYVEPSARGRGVGARLVETCIQRARALGYRRLSLWTNDVLVSARRIYQAAGFRLVEETPHHSFGRDLVGQTWVLGLD
jgi:DNA-binding MarR family transcriptional regulator/N-acetylglutamate synthase-like GNAT family acetyltransferase